MWWCCVGDDLHGCRGERARESLTCPYRRRSAARRTTRSTPPSWRAAVPSSSRYARVDRIAARHMCTIRRCSWLAHASSSSNCADQEDDTRDQSRATGAACETNASRTSGAEHSGGMNATPYGVAANGDSSAPFIRHGTQWLRVRVVDRVGSTCRLGRAWRRSIRSIGSSPSQRQRSLHSTTRADTRRM